jgi:hypothetical protein
MAVEGKTSHCLFSLDHLKDGVSSKQEKAVKLIEKGAGLEIISELDFLRNL